MKLQTQIPIKKESKNLINYQSKILLVGSCFSENIGKKLSYFKFQTTQNPLGILFHPKAIETLITNAINKKVYKEKDIILNNERWHCFDAHSSLSSPDKNKLLNNLNSSILATNKELKEASHIVFTLGTSWVYKHLESKTIVTNCHKIPQKQFLKKILSIDEITTSLKNSISAIKSINNKASIVFTVSPVRHLKDGFIENTRSKSNLISAIHNILNESNVFYFPSYEIMMDELRDYRFYTEDMIHPNKTAINYIFEKFVNTWFSENTKIIMKEIDTIQKGISHKPFHQNSDRHQLFLQELSLRKEKLKAKLPHIQF